MTEQRLRLTIDQAYAAMYRFLEHEYEMTGSDEIGGLLSSLSLLEEGGTADPATWNDWLQAINIVLNGDNDIELKITSD